MHLPHVEEEWKLLSGTSSFSSHLSVPPHTMIQPLSGSSSFSFYSRYLHSLSSILPAFILHVPLMLASHLPGINIKSSSYLPVPPNHSFCSHPTTVLFLFPSTPGICILCHMFFPYIFYTFHPYSVLASNLLPWLFQIAPFFLLQQFSPTCCCLYWINLLGCFSFLWSPGQK